MKKKQTAKEIDIVAKIRGIIEVKGYLGIKDRVVYGVYDDNEGLWVLDDGDMFSIKDLVEDEGYDVRAVTGEMIREEGKKEKAKEIYKSILKLKSINIKGDRIITLKDIVEMIK